MSLSYENKEMLYDIKDPDSVVVIDVNCQGIVENDRVMIRVKSEWPRIYNKYKASVISNTVKPGTILLLKEGKYNVCLMFTTNRVAGMFKDKTDEIAKQTITCVQALKNIADSRKIKRYYSGILNRHSSSWPEVASAISKLDFKWTIYKE